MREIYSDRGHRKFGDDSVRKIELGLQNGNPSDIFYGLGKRGVEGSARDSGRAIAEQMYRKGDGIPISPEILSETAGDTPSGVFVDGGVLRDPGMTDEEHAQRVAGIAHFPSMAARIIEASGGEIPPVVESDMLS